ncbi:MAG: type II toxin-antitoxin system RelE/ParE family toxin [Methylococcaceae bacterium]|jgi:toxin ParE1/3/4
MQVKWTVSAGSDRENAINYIAVDSLTAALSQLDEIERQTDRLADYPKLGRPGRVKGTRELVVNRTPFIVVYRIKGEIIQILRVLHGAQQWP